MMNNVTFNEETHTYYVNDIKVCSVTELVNAFFDYPYKNVNKALLSDRANKGSIVHKELELHIKDNRAVESNEAKYFIELEQKHAIKPVFSEKMITLALDNKIVACGTFDLLCFYDNELTLIDFKTTSTIHLQEVILQLNLYALGLKQTYFNDEFTIDFDNLKLKVIQLRDNLFNVRELPKLKDEVVIEKLRIALKKIMKETPNDLIKNAQQLETYIACKQNRKINDCSQCCRFYEDCDTLIEAIVTTYADDIDTLKEYTGGKIRHAQKLIKEMQRLLEIDEKR